MKKTIDYKTTGTCAKTIHLSTEDGYILSASFEGGCDGNLQGIGALIRGKRCEEVAALLEGIKCGRRNTSCPDQLSRALKQIMQDSEQA